MGIEIIKRVEMVVCEISTHPLGQNKDAHPKINVLFLKVILALGFPKPLSIPNVNFDYTRKGEFILVGEHLNCHPERSEGSTFLVCRP